MNQYSAVMNIIIYLHRNLISHIKGEKIKGGRENRVKCLKILPFYAGGKMYLKFIDISNLVYGIETRTGPVIRKI